MENLKISDFVKLNNPSCEELLQQINASRKFHNQDPFVVDPKDTQRMFMPLARANTKLLTFVWINMARELIRKGIIVVGDGKFTKLPTNPENVEIIAVNLETGITTIRYANMKITQWGASMLVAAFIPSFPTGLVPLRVPPPQFSSALLTLPSRKKRNRSSCLSYNRLPGEGTTILDELWSK